MQKRVVTLGVGLVLLALTVSATAAELHGVKMPDAITLEGKSLKLNGIGIRTKTILAIKVYVAALYLETRSKSAGQVMASDAARELRITMTHNAPRERIVGEVRDGIQANAKDPGAIKDRLDKVLRWLPSLSEGTSLIISYLPGKGTRFAVNGSGDVMVPGKDFADAVFAAWLGQQPLDDDLKRQLLGG